MVVSDLVYKAYKGRMKVKESYRLEKRVSSLRTTMFRYRKAAAKRKRILFSLCLVVEEKKSIISLNHSAKKKQERKSETGVIDCLGML